ncbi:unnamed protein product [Aureobasidium uvarum]|uniref:TauD/TfdA-like domain-containing protein n=1 Tax=Aureobasidium uvarum TaxID=2773716 RepID=A0A9N8KRU8_9PEZI|nr:unnamed protein product [Aureobasidium uvarum]
MSAAVRPAAAVLRRARHVPVSQCLARRWQTSAAKRASYDEMLDLMEKEYPDLNKPRDHPPRTPESSQPEQPARQQYDQQTVQQQYEQQDVQQQTRQRGPHTAFRTLHQPGTASQPTQESSNPRTKTAGRENARSPPRFKPTKETLPESQRRTATDGYKPRRVPPPVYKASPDQGGNHTLPEQAATHRSQTSIEQLEQSRPLTEASEQSQAPQRTLDPTVPAPETSPILIAELNLESKDTEAEEPSTTARFKPRKISSPMVSEALRKPPTRTKPTARMPTETPLADTNFNPLETVSIRGKIFDNIFLRDACACSQCVDISTRQKRFDSADIPSNIRIRSLDSGSGPDSETVITWKHDVHGFGPDHVTRLSNKLLVRSTLYPKTHEYTGGKWAWNKSVLEERMVDFEYNEYMSDEKVLFRMLEQLQMFGLVFIKNLPEAESSVIQTANRIGPLKNTFYGETWDVRSVSNAKNVAYTDVHLGFHMDLLYMQQPPRLQLLHCLRASDQGGVSLFSDAYQSMQAVYDMDQAAFEALCETPVNFHYDNDNHHYFRSRRTFQLREGINKLPEKLHGVWNYMAAVNWAPPFQAPFNHTKGDVAFARSIRAWHEAAQIFRNMTEMKENIYSRQMAPGECVVFDNRRVLHARTAFAGGERWLRGAYLDDDPYLSKMRVLGRTYANIRRSGRVRPTPAPSLGI